MVNLLLDIFHANEVNHYNAIAPFVIPLAISAATSLGKVAYGAVQAIGGNKKLNQLEKNRPQRTTDENILYNQKFARVNAANGLGGLNDYTNDINRTYASSINAILSGGGDINQVAELMSGTNNSFNQLMRMDAEAKLANQDKFIAANTALANENMANWDYNINIPFQQKYARYTQRTNAGAQNINTGLDALGKTALAAATGFSQDNDGNYKWTGGKDASSNYNSTYNSQTREGTLYT
jgi:hypothetical protein